jgi:hypothetical protein
MQAYSCIRSGVFYAYQSRRLLLISVTLLFLEQLKQENEELRAELQVTRQKQAELTSIAQQHPNPPSTANDDIAYEKTMLRQELHLLQVRVQLQASLSAKNNRQVFVKIIFFFEKVVQ